MIDILLKEALNTTTLTIEPIWAQKRRFLFLFFTICRSYHFSNFQRLN